MPPVLDYASPPSPDDDLVPASEFASPVEANLALAYLDAEGIPATLAGENVSVTIGITSGLARITLLVPRGHLARAVDLLRAQEMRRRSSKRDEMSTDSTSIPSIGRGRLLWSLLLAVVLLVLLASILMMS